MRRLVAKLCAVLVIGVLTVPLSRNRLFRRRFSVVRSAEMLCVTAELSPALC